MLGMQGLIGTLFVTRGSVSILGVCCPPFVDYFRGNGVRIKRRQYGAMNQCPNIYPIDRG